MEKLYQVVNNHDEVIGHKLRRDIDPKKDITRVSALWLVNSKNEVLIARRATTKIQDPGKWGPAATGTLEKDETYIANIYREVEEEIGLTGVRMRQLARLRFHTPEAFCQFYAGLCDMPAVEFILQPKEVEEIRWVDRNVLYCDATTKPHDYLPSMANVMDKVLTEY